MTLSLVTLAVMIMEYLERLMPRVTGQKGSDHLNVGVEEGGCSRTFTCIYTNTQVNSSSLTLSAKGHGRRCCQIGTVSSVVPVSPL